MAMPDRLIVLCRPGFENDCAAELAQRAEEGRVGGWARTVADSGLVEFFTGDADPFDLLSSSPFAERVFARQWFAAGEAIDDLPPEDRISPLVETLSWPVSDALVEVPEGDAHLPLSKLASKLAGPLRGALQKRHLWTPDDESAPRLHVVLDTGARAWVGLSPPHRSSPDAGGVHRLRSHRDAPSRSALKLEEGLMTLLNPVDRHMLFDGRITAVDLGAAPGGWTWVMRRQGAYVIAVDNGRMAPSLEADPEVEHVRADAFTFQPPRTVEWLVCDVVDKPARVVELMARWLRRGWAERAMFNLKLPMQKRWRAVAEARGRFEKILGERSGDFDLHIRQLYHDREEVTCYAEPRS
ncbi:MAG TPA: 23S rRNA (cytidine(2498)-2'-O)-methyltransferase RlmM [Pseudomonadales bacterium]|nr:23S rRNA (cytidine(2498)-2'-O)-methyltransferase RlmM [Pseudomonadales bacterium]